MESAKQCVCNESSCLIIERKKVSRITSLLLLCAFFIFVAGYFLGKRNAIKQFDNELQQEAFADQIQYSLHTMYQHKQTQESNEEHVVQAQNSSNEMESITTDAPVSPEPITTVQQTVPAITEKKEPVITKRYQAQLFGGRQRDVQRFVQKLQNKGFDVEVKKRRSKTAKGKVINWYQAVTKSYSNKDELIALVDAIKQQEKLRDVPIVTV